MLFDSLIVNSNLLIDLQRIVWNKLNFILKLFFSLMCPTGRRGCIVVGITTIMQSVPIPLMARRTRYDIMW
jgi:hypothetical protein